MPSAFTHAAAATAISAWFYRPAVPKRVWLAGILCSIVPDLDAIGFWVGVPYGSLFGHRGITHSLCYAGLLAALIALPVRRRFATGRTAARLWLYLFLVTASHGLLDAFTDGGLGVALLAPFDSRRYFSSVRPIAVAPISVTGFFTARGLSVFASEVLWVWGPAALLFLAAPALRRARARPA